MSNSTSLFQRDTSTSRPKSSVLEKTYAKLFTEPNTSVCSDEELAAAEEGRYSWLRPKLDISSSPRMYWQAFQAMRQVGQAETRRMSYAEVELLCSPRLS